MKKIVAKRIINARKLRGFSQQNVADKLNISKQMVSKYEKGILMPTSSRLLELSRLFNLKVDYFFNSFSVEIGTVNFRKKSKFSVKQQNALKEKIKIKLENYLWLENTLSIDSSFVNVIKNIPIGNTKSIEEAVSKLKIAWNIGTDPVHNIIQLLEDHKIKIIELNDVDDKFDGLAAFADDKFPVIVVNGNFPVERKRFTLLHELGHLLLNIPKISPKEEENLCNKFASEFLLPINSVIAEFGKKRTSVTLAELKVIQKKYGISIPAIIYGLVDAKVIPQLRQKQFYMRINTNRNLKKEVNLSRFETPENSSRFERLVYRALAQETITISKASFLLEMNINTLRKNIALV